MVKTCGCFNPGSRKSIKFSVENDKNFIVIYGKNETAKTVFSESQDFKKRYVFNEIYMRENIHISNEDEIRISPGNRENFSKIFVGANIIGLQKEKDYYDKNMNNYREKQKDHLEFIKNKLESTNIDVSIIEAINKRIHLISELDAKIVYDDLTKEIKKIDYEVAVGSEDKFEENLKLYKNI